MQQDERLALAALDVMQADAIDFEETTLRRISALGVLREPVVDEGRNRQRGDADRGSGCVRVVADFGQRLSHARTGRHQRRLRLEDFHEFAPCGNMLSHMPR